MEQVTAKFDRMMAAQQCCYLQDCLNAGWRCNTNWTTFSTDAAVCSTQSQWSHAPGRQATNFGTLAPDILTIIMTVFPPYKNVYWFARNEQTATCKT